MKRLIEKQKRRKRRKMSIRRRISGTNERPRLSVFKSGANIYCQIIDDREGRTLCAAGTLDRELRDTLQGVKKVEAAGRVGAAIAERAKERGIVKVKFDRGAYHYSGRVAALAEHARKGGLEF